MRFLSTAAMICALGAPALAEQPEPMTEATRTAFRAEVRAYLLDNPEVLIEAMDVLRNREAVAEARADAEILAELGPRVYNDGKSWVGGNPDGDITIVEFLDYRCGYCRRAHQEIKALLEDDGNIRWVVKELPILGPDSEVSSRLAIATLQTQGDAAYGRLHDVLMSFEGPVNEQTLPIIAKRAGIDLSAAAPVMDSDAVTRHIAEVRALSQVLNVTGTPAFVVGTSVLRGYLPKANMQAIVDQERDKAG